MIRDSIRNLIRDLIRDKSDHEWKNLPANIHHLLISWYSILVQLWFVVLKAAGQVSPYKPSGTKSNFVSGNLGWMMESRPSMQISEVVTSGQPLTISNVNVTKNNTVIKFSWRMKWKTSQEQFFLSFGTQLRSNLNTIIYV